MSLITLVRPPTVVPRWAIAATTCPPIGLAYIASSLKKAGHEVDVIDAIGESIFQMLQVPNQSHLLAHGLSLNEIADRVNPHTDIIGISCMFSHEWPLTRELVKKLKARFSNKPIIGGGEHITCLKEWILKTCPEMDYCILGEGEEKIVELVNLLSAGKTPSKINGVLSRDTPPQPQREGPIDFALMKQRMRDIDSIPPPAWELFPLSSYLDNEFGFGVNRGRSMPMLVTRGCPYSAHFAPARKCGRQNGSREIQ